MSINSLARVGRLALSLTAASGASAVAGAEKGTAPERALFDGKSLAGWTSSDFDKGGEVKVVNPFRDNRAAIVVEAGAYLSGITWTDEASLPRSNYEISLEAMRLEGRDFFCGLTFPVGKSAATFIMGGWGGSVAGISSVDDSDASENETATNGASELNRWYRIRVRVTDEKIEAWIDDEQVVNLETKGRKISLRFGEIERSLPLGIATYQTKAAYRDIRLRKL